MAFMIASTQAQQQSTPAQERLHYKGFLGQWPKIQSIPILEKSGAVEFSQQIGFEKGVDDCGMAIAGK